MPSDVERLATIEANMSSMGKSLDEVVGWLKSSSQQRNTQHTETVSRLAVIESTVKSYQDTCLTDRKEINDKVDRLERIQSRQSGQAAGWAAAISIFIGFFAAGIEWLKK